MSMLYSIKQTTTPDEPVSAAELADHCRVNTGTAEYDQLALFISAARELFEAETDGCIVLPTTFVQYVPCWDCPIRLERGNVLSVGGITYVDTDGNIQTTYTYSTDLTGTPAYVYPTSFPNLEANNPRPIAIEFTAGWADVDYIPKDVLLAIKCLAAFFYEYRESHTELNLSEVPMGFKRVCAKYRTSLAGGI